MEIERPLIVVVLESGCVYEISDVGGAKVPRPLCHGRARHIDFEAVVVKNGLRQAGPVGGSCVLFDSYRLEGFEARSHVFSVSRDCVHVDTAC